MSDSVLINGAPIRSTIACAGRFRSCAATHVGMVRSRNEDNFVNRPDLGVWAVADGAGGHDAGDVAARIVTDALTAMPPGLGASELLAASDVGPEELRRRVTSPKGTTERAIAVLESADLTSLFDRATASALARAEELAGPS